MYERILLATDGSNPAEAATKHALELAETYDAMLYVLYALKPMEPESGVQDPVAEEDPDTRGKQAVAATIERADERGIDAVDILAEGTTTSEAILTAIDEEDVDLVVMGTHGRDGLDRLLVGSVAEKVTREATVPVLTYHPPDA